MKVIVVLGEDGRVTEAFADGELDVEFIRSGKANENVTGLNEVHWELPEWDENEEEE